MIIKKEVLWNKDYANDGILYFSQRIVEMLDFRTIDIYRAPVSNTTSLIKEYLNVYEGAAKEHNLEVILQETVFSLENDIILLEKFGEDKIREIVKKIHSSKDKERVLEYLFTTIAPKYLEWTKEYLTKIIFESKSKKKIEKAVRCFIPQLLNTGYNRDDIYRRAREILFSKNPVGAAKEFIDYYDGKYKEFTVYFGLNLALKDFEKILKDRLSIEISKKRHLELWDDYFEVCKKKVKAYDAGSAAELVRTQVELFVSYFQFFGNFSGSLIQNNAIILSSDGKEHSALMTYNKYNTVEEGNKIQIGEVAEKVVTCLVYGSRCSMTLLNKITQMHNRAISNNGLQNGFLNFWSILEVLCVKKEGNKINQVIEKVVPILKKDYIVCIMEDLAQNLKTILGDDAFSSFISKIDEGKSNHEKIAMFLLLEKYNKDFDTFTDGFVNYPVIRSRMINIHDDFSTNTRAYLNLSERYAQRVTWHLFRIYRVRNSIAHNGQRHKLIKDIGEHLHSYVDAVMLNVIVKLATTQLCKEENVFVSDSFEIDNINAKLSSVEPFNEETVKLLFQPEIGTINYFEE